MTLAQTWYTNAWFPKLKKSKVDSSATIVEDKPREDTVLLLTESPEGPTITQAYGQMILEIAQAIDDYSQLYEFEELYQSISKLLIQSSSALDALRASPSTPKTDDILEDKYIHATPKATYKARIKFTFVGRGSPPGPRDIEVSHHEIADYLE